MKIMIVVTHLLGSGHLARALTLARAMQKAGQTVSVVSGGMPALLLDNGDVPLVQLPPLRSDGTDFARLLDRSGQVASSEYRAARSVMLGDLLQRQNPDVVVTELFPFGRRSLRDEFQHLLYCARKMSKPPLVAASVRDILAPPSKEAKARYARDMIAEHYDAVLVHSDPAVVGLNMSWPVTPDIAEKLHYTGFVAPLPAAPPVDGIGKGEIIVSAGGGAGVGLRLFDAASAAARVDQARRWRILVGGMDARERIAAMDDLPGNVIVEPARPDFRNLLRVAGASVSLCGYNTALDVLQSGCRALFVPFDEGGEVEQTLRANALSQLPGIAMRKASELTGAVLLEELDELCLSPHRAPSVEGMDGAAETARVLLRLKEGRR